MDKPQNDAEETKIAEVDAEIQEGEIVSSSENTQTDQGPAVVLESLESLIRENLAKISKLSKELNLQKEMLDSVLQNDETYKQHEETAKAAQKVKTATKKEILKRSDVARVDEKVRNLATEIKEARESLNSYLPEYQRLSGTNEINDENGEPMEIVYVAKLVKRRA